MYIHYFITQCIKILNPDELRFKLIPVDCPVSSLEESFEFTFIHLKELDTVILTSTQYQMYMVIHQFKGNKPHLSKQCNTDSKCHHSLPEIIIRTKDITNLSSISTHMPERAILQKCHLAYPLFL